MVLQKNRLRWYGHVLQKEDIDWVKICMDYEVEGSRVQTKRQTNQDLETGYAKRLSNTYIEKGRCYGL